MEFVAGIFVKEELVQKIVIRDKVQEIWYKGIDAICCGYLVQGMFVKEELVEKIVLVQGN